MGKCLWFPRQLSKFFLWGQGILREGEERGGEGERGIVMSNRKGSQMGNYGIWNKNSFREIRKIKGDNKNS